jgi:1-acyl-sn-glycerol-3-phosphate acyltransferase
MKYLAYLPSVIYYLLFLLTLLIFHPIQWLSLKVGGYQAHKKSVDVMNCILLNLLRVLGTRISFTNQHELPKGVPYIIVANHQSVNDIISIGYFLRRLHPKYISKKELGKNIPSVSFNLRHGGSVLIDRSSGSQSIKEIIKIGSYIEKNNRSAVIFPEGTRSRDGKPKPFYENGLKFLVKKAPSAYLLPVTINNSWKSLKYGGFPMALGVKLQLHVHKPLKVSDYEFEELFKTVEAQIKSKIV